MAFIPVPNAVEMVLIHSIAGQVLNNVLGFEFPDVPDTVDLADLAGAAIAQWIIRLAPNYSADLDLNAVKCTSLQSASAPTVTVTAPAGTDGDINIQSVPTNVAIVISQSTAQRGRSFRGRTYLGGLSEDGSLDASRVTDAYLANLLAGFTNFITDLETSEGVTHGVISRYTNNAPRVTGIITPITGYSANADYDSQRRRLAGRGI